MKLRTTSSTLFFAAIMVSIIALGATACSSPNQGVTTTNSTTNSATNNMMPTPASISMPGMAQGSGMQSAPGAASAPYDLQFIDTMKAHHQSAIQMARMAEEKAQHAELKSMAKNVIESQQKEIEQMKSWRDGWYAGKPPAMNMVMPGMMDSMKDPNMAKMESASGTQFDLAFLDMMIPHHAGAVTMSKDALTKAEHPEIKTFAQKIVDEQQQEIGEMNKWKVAWSNK